MADILVVDDESSILELIKYNLKKTGFSVRVCTTAELAMESINSKIPDLIILDWMLPGISGYDLVKNIRKDKQRKLLPIVFLTAKSEEIDKIRALDAGCDDYLSKPFSIKELIARINAVLRRTAPHHTSDVCQIGNLTLDPAKKEVLLGNKKINLGPKEFKILHFFLTHKNKIYTRNQILDAVWGNNVFIDDRTVDVHIRGIRKNLEISKNNVLIKTIRGSGYILQAD